MVLSAVTCSPSVRCIFIAIVVHFVAWPANLCIVCQSSITDWQLPSDRNSSLAPLAAWPQKVTVPPDLFSDAASLWFGFIPPHPKRFAELPPEGVIQTGVTAWECW